MATSGNKGGQRSNTSSASGRKKRSATSTSHKGSRVEPSHLAEHARDVREKKKKRQGTRNTAKQKR